MAVFGYKETDFEVFTEGSDQRIRRLESQGFIFGAQAKWDEAVILKPDEGSDRFQDLSK